MGNSGQKKIDYTNPLSQYKSGKTAKVVTQREIDEKKAKLESSHQLKFCKWLKHYHPEVRFRSDMQAGRKRSYQMQNLTDILDPYSGWPDITIYHKSCNYIGLMIELKRELSGIWLKDGSLSSQKHVQEQAMMHEFLRSLGWCCVFAEGFDEAKRKFEEYIKN